jgi:P4 family phage/plasmid primase-like protien
LHSLLRRERPDDERIDNMIQHKLSSNQYTGFEQLEQDDAAVQQHDTNNGYYQCDDGGTQDTETQQRKLYELIYKHAPDGTFVTIQGFKHKEKGGFVEVFPAHDIDGIVDCVRRHRDDPKTNVYHSCSALIERPAKGKRGDEELIAGTCMLWADADPYNLGLTGEQVDKVINSFIHKPSFDIFTGRGRQFGWILNQFCTDLSLVKAVNKWIERQFLSIGADNVSDPTRVLRAPGTFNHKTNPPTESRILHMDASLVYQIGDFNWESLSAEENITYGETIGEEELPHRFLEELRGGTKSEQLLYSRIFSEETARETEPPPPMRDDGGRIDRSANDWFISRQMLTLGYTIGQIVAVLTHHEWFSGSRFRERLNYNYVNRTVKGAVYKKGKDASQFFEGKRFIPDLMMNAIIKAGTPFLRLLGREDIQVDGLWSYHGGVYRRTGEQFIREECVIRLGKLWASRHAEETIKLMRSNRDIPTHILYDDPVRHSAKDCYINTDSGMVNVATGELTEHDPKYRSFLQVPVIYDPRVGAGEVDAFIREVLPEDAVDTFWEFVGYCLLLDCRFKKALFLLGDRDSGKSTICFLLKRFLGRNGVISTSLQDICDSRFEFSNLLHVFANIYPDLPATDLKNYGRFKGMTSGDSDKGERKFEQSFSFSATAKHIFSANAFVPTADPEVDAYVNRWIVIKLEHAFRDEEDDGVQKANTHLIEELSTPQCMSEILNHALAGLQRLLTNDKFTKSESITAAGDEYREMLDSVYACIAHATETDFSDDGFIAKDQMTAGYTQWCAKGENRFPAGGPKFHVRMKSIMRKFKMREGEKRMPVIVVDKDGTKTQEWREVRGYWGRRWKEGCAPSEGILVKRRMY